MPSPIVPNNEVPKDGNGDVISNDINVITSTTELPEDIPEEEWNSAEVKDFGIEEGTYYFLFKNIYNFYKKKIKELSDRL